MNPLPSPVPASAETPHRRAIRSFVKREGRLTPAQADALTRLWPRYGVGEIEEESGLARIDALDPEALFGRRAPLRVEIGFGNGEHLATLAASQPDANVLGLEVHRPGVGRLLHRAEELDLHNLRVACADAVQVLERALPAASVDEVFVLFPDPWPKKRHHKRRLIQPAFAAVLARVIGAGGGLKLATDWADYATHMREVLDAAPGFVNLAGAAGFMPRPETRPVTRFEARGQRLGHAVFDLAYRRVGAP